jgi:hypothetical protein
MSYGIIAFGTKEDAEKIVTVQCDSNTSPEMPLIKSFLLDLLSNVDGAEKRVLIEASGWHSGGAVQHKMDFRTILVPST